MLNKKACSNDCNGANNKSFDLNQSNSLPIYIFNVKQIIFLDGSGKCSTSIVPFNQNINATGIQINSTNLVNSANAMKTGTLLFNNLPKKTLQKCPFTKEEDDLILDLVKSLGENKWSLISKKMKQYNFNRNIRQCKDRYFHYLNPKINNSEWTPEEDKLLIQKIKEIGYRWKKLEPFFSGRTEVSLRNRYNLLIRKQNKINRKIDKKIDIMSDHFSFLDSYHNKKKPCKKYEVNENNESKNSDEHLSERKIQNNEIDLFNFDTLEIIDNKSYNYDNFESSFLM